MLGLAGDRMHAPALAIDYVTDRCNSRRVMCDHLQNHQTVPSMYRANELAAEFHRLRTRWVLLSGGEPLLHPERLHPQMKRIIL